MGDFPREAAVGRSFLPLFPRRLESIRIYRRRKAILASVAGIFQKAFYLVLVPKRRFRAIRDILVIQSIRTA